MTVRAIRCGTLFDGTGAVPLRDAVVIVEDGRIAARPAATTPARRAPRRSTSATAS